MIEELRTIRVAIDEKAFVTNVLLDELIANAKKQVAEQYPNSTFVEAIGSDRQLDGSIRLHCRVWVKMEKEKK